MNADTRTELDRIPVPVDPAGYPARAVVVRDAAGAWRTAWMIGVSKEPFGLPYPSAKAAAAASRYLNARSAA